MLFGSALAFSASGILIGLEGFGIAEFILAFAGFLLILWRDELIRGE